MSDTADTRDLVSSERSGAPAIPGAIAVWSDGKPLLVAIAFDGDELVLGRDEARGIVDDRVSRTHATVTREHGVWTVRDEDSRNGTFVNGKRATGPMVAEPPRIVRLAYTVFLLVDDLRPYREAAVTTDGDRVVGPSFAAVLARARATTADSVLVTGETGVGKELVARELHATTGGPFVSVNCATIPEAIAEIDGYIAAADGGVLFLDEVGELPAAVQAKLLRVIETRDGVTTRFCFATHRNLRTAIADGTFRPELYYRIARTELHVPALRERRDEIPWLVAHELGARQGHARLVEHCLGRTWPGNIRELRTAIRAALESATAAGQTLVRVEDLAPTAGQPLAVSATTAAKPGDITRDQLVAAIAEHDQNMSAVARALGLHRSQLYRLLEQYKLERT